MHNPGLTFTFPCCLKGGGQISPRRSTSKLAASPSACQAVPITAPCAFCRRGGAAGRFAHPSLSGRWCEGTRYRCCSPLQPPGEMTVCWHLFSLPTCAQSMCTEVDSNLDVSRSGTITSSERQRWRSAEPNCIISICGQLLRISAA